MKFSLYLITWGKNTSDFGSAENFFYNFLATITENYDVIFLLLLCIILIHLAIRFLIPSGIKNLFGYTGSVTYLLLLDVLIIISLAIIIWIIYQLLIFSCDITYNAGPYVPGYVEREVYSNNGSGIKQITHNPGKYTTNLYKVYSYEKKACFTNCNIALQNGYEVQPCSGSGHIPALRHWTIRAGNWHNLSNIEDFDHFNTVYPWWAEFGSGDAYARYYDIDLYEVRYRYDTDQTSTPKTALVYRHDLAYSSHDSVYKKFQEPPVSGPIPLGGPMVPYEAAHATPGRFHLHQGTVNTLSPRMQDNTLPHFQEWKDISGRLKPSQVGIFGDDQANKEWGFPKKSDISIRHLARTFARF